jgi:lipid II:glycine glycyltransferase (peptidoglycan interpeptide bridge formation enzyme)
VPSTLQEARDQREKTARSVVERIKELSLECKQLSSQSEQTYEHLAEDPKIKTMESQLKEAKMQVEIVQVKFKPLLLHIIFVIPMIVNDVNLSIAFRGVTVA